MRSTIYPDQPSASAWLAYRRQLLHCKRGDPDYDPTRMKSFDTRFTSVVYPGERIETDIWLTDDVVRFRCRVPERNVVVLDHGECRISA